MSAIATDGTLRYFIASSDGRERYLIELDAYDGNGQCSCPHFRMRLEPLLRRGVTPELAHASGMVAVKSGRLPSETLMCRHIVSARKQFCDAVIKAIGQHETKKPNPQDQATPARPTR